jgi:hypothetical protein
MTKEHYETLLTVLTEKVKAQETELYLKDYEIGNLKRKLAEAEGMESPQPRKHKPIEIR